MKQKSAGGRRRHLDVLEYLHENGCPALETSSSG